MSQLSWGKCTIEKATSTKGTPAEQWTAIDTPKEDTTKLTPTAGTQKRAAIWSIQELARILISSSSICLSRKAAHVRLKTLTALLRENGLSVSRLRTKRPRAFRLTAQQFVARRVIQPLTVRCFITLSRF